MTRTLFDRVLDAVIPGRRRQREATAEFESVHERALGLIEAGYRQMLHTPLPRDGDAPIWVCRADRDDVPTLMRSGAIHPLYNVANAYWKPAERGDVMERLFPVTECSVEDGSTEPSTIV